ncbi:MAG TPA: hypothetical protein VLA56_19750 [Pseudomonadales bacterium]|nr:hypothetical protein [Pseudomonadales bacterium]
MPDTATMLWGVLFGSIGIGYFMWGKKAGRPVARYAGIALMFYPWFVSGPFALVAIGAGLMATPWMIRLQDHPPRG